MKYRFYIVDVFTERAFGGNQLAVFPEADGLSSEQMLSITREFNFSESTFVLPPADTANTRKVRIFTPSKEIPFAGHPNVGTAFALAATDTVDLQSELNEFRFEELAGVVPVVVRSDNGKPVQCELTAPEALSTGKSYSATEIARVLGLDQTDVSTANHQPTIASVGLPFVLAEIASRDALGRATPDLAAMATLLSDTGLGAVHLYTRDCDDLAHDLQTRMFSAGLGQAEDPATGSANGALAAYLAHCDPNPNCEYRLTIAQGIEMGRPSTLYTRVEKRAGTVEAVRVAGAAVLVAEGYLAV